MSFDRDEFAKVTKEWVQQLPNCMDPTEAYHKASQEFYRYFSEFGWFECEDTNHPMYEICRFMQLVQDPFRYHSFESGNHIEYQIKIYTHLLDYVENYYPTPIENVVWYDELKELADKEDERSAQLYPEEPNRDFDPQGG